MFGVGFKKEGGNWRNLLADRVKEEVWMQLRFTRIVLIYFLLL